MNDIISLNVGGTVFYTTKTTLTKYDGSYFNGLLNESYYLLKDKNDNIFIDRSPDNFPQILSYLRD